MFILSLFVSTLIYGCMDGEHDKEKGKEGKSVTESSDNGLDPFEEYNRYIKQPQLNWDDCPNPISWWGVQVMSHCLFYALHD